MLTHNVQHLGQKCGFCEIFLVCSIQVHPLESLLVDWAWSGLGSGHMIPLHMISHMVGLRKDPLYTSPFWLDTVPTACYIQFFCWILYPISPSPPKIPRLALLSDPRTSDPFYPSHPSDALLLPNPLFWPSFLLTWWTFFETQDYATLW
jgi:hypothetical protein